MLKRLREWIGTLADVATLAALGLSAVGSAVVGAYLILRSAGVGWSILAAIGAFLLIAAATRFGWSWLNRRVDPVGEETYLRDRRIQLNDLVSPGDPMVRGRTLENCRLFGPGVIAFKGCTVANSGFDGSLSTIFVEVPDGSTVVGPILFEDCVLRGCRFHGIGVIGTPEQIAQMRQGFTQATRPG